MAQKPQDAARRKLACAARQCTQHLPVGLPPVFFLTDPDRIPEPASVAARLPKGWGVIYRHFGRADRSDIATRLARLSHVGRLTLLIAADPQLAVKVGAAGIHWPFAERHKARKWRNRFPVMTVSAHTPRQFRAIDPSSFDAVLLSTVFSSSSPSAGMPMGPLKFRNLVRTTSIPVFGLGGVTSDTAAHISRSAGLAAIEGIASQFERKLEFEG